MGERTLTDEDINAMFSEINGKIDALTERVDELAAARKEAAGTIGAEDYTRNDKPRGRLERARENIFNSIDLPTFEYPPRKLIYEILCEDMSFGGIEFTFVSIGWLGKKIPGKDKSLYYDVYLSNETTIAFIKTNDRISLDDLDHLINVQLPEFKQVFPESKICLGLGGESFDSGVEEEALRRGIGTINLGGEDVVINDKDVKAW